MIAGISEVMYLSEITAPGGIIVPGSLYDFNGTYADANYIAPGFGYWVRAYEPGDVTFTKTIAAAKTGEFQRFTDVNTLQVSNGNGLKTTPLYFGLTIADEKERLSYSMPPAPPEGAFDVRLANNWRYIENSGSLAIQDESKELTIAYEIVDGSQWVLSGEKQYLLEGSGEITITGNVSELNLSKAVHESLPNTFSLSQNFPNPFNPQTNIYWSMHGLGKVAIEIYNVQGQFVAILFDGQKGLGNHEIIWDATTYPSGIYFYRLTMGETVLQKKMILLR